MEVWITEGPRVNFIMREALFEIYTWILRLSYLHEKQTSRIQSLYLYFIKIVPFRLRCFWTVSSYKGCLHFSDITSPWGLGCGKNVGLQDFARLWICCHWRGIHASKTHFVGNSFNYMLWWSSCWNIILINVIIILSSIISQQNTLWIRGFVCCKLRESKSICECM